MDVRVLKLTTGEEIVGEFIAETDESITVKNTLSLIIQPSQNSIGYAFVPWCPMVQGNKTIKFDKTLFVGSATDELVSSYQSMFSQIMTPPPKQFIV
jgi:hypothetical protein